jgi:glycosyltransferase involved in cell wall biosynthesis
MKICLFGQFPPHIGGVSSHLFLLSQELLDRGDEVWVLTYPHPQMRDFNGIQVQSAWAPPVKGLRGLFFSVSSFFKLIRVVRNQKLDLIHAHYILPPGLIAVLVGSLMGIRTAVTVHGSDLFILAQKPLLKQITRWVLKKADYVMVVSEALDRKVQELGISPQKVKLTPNAVDVERFSPDNQLPPDVQLDSQKTTLLFVGNLVPQKGVKYLLEAKKILDNTLEPTGADSDFELIIVGDGPLRKDLERQVRDYDIKSVVFLGERRDVELIMPSTDLFILPSISEGFPITILESLASGIPVVATRVGGVEEIESGSVMMVVEPGQPEALAQAIKQMEEHGLTEEVRKKARETARKYAHIKIPY